MQPTTQMIWLTLAVAFGFPAFVAVLHVLVTGH